MSLEATINAINQKLDKLAKPKPYWVSAEVIMDMTGWDKKMMQRQREANEDLWKITKGGGYLYNINMIPDSLIKKQA